MPPSRAVLLAVLTGVLAGGTACGAGDELRGAMSPTAEPPRESAPTTAAAPADAGATGGPCVGDRLAVSLGPTTESGDTVAQDLILQNTGPTACVMRGFPLVVPVAGNEGATVGDPALPVGERGARLRLEPRAAATVPLRVRSVDAYDEQECRPKAVRGLQLRPPGGSGPVFVPREGTACSAEQLDPPQATVGTAVAR